eukprot:scaffold276_cov132-Cylindrotheca_fusiformis.AAC.2
MSDSVSLISDDFSEYSYELDDTSVDPAEELEEEGCMPIHEELHTEGREGTDHSRETTESEYVEITLGNDEHHSISDGISEERLEGKPGKERQRCSVQTNSECSDMHSILLDDLPENDEGFDLTIRRTVEMQISGITLYDFSQSNLSEESWQRATPDSQGYRKRTKPAGLGCDEEAEASSTRAPKMGKASTPCSRRRKRLEVGPPLLEKDEHASEEKLNELDGPSSEAGTSELRNSMEDSGPRETRRPPIASFLVVTKKENPLSPTLSVQKKSPKLVGNRSSDGWSKVSPNLVKPKKSPFLKSNPEAKWTKVASKTKGADLSPTAPIRSSGQSPRKDASHLQGKRMPQETVLSRPAMRSDGNTTRAEIPYTPDLDCSFSTLTDISQGSAQFESIRLSQSSMDKSPSLPTRRSDDYDEIGAGVEAPYLEASSFEVSRKAPNGRKYDMVKQSSRRSVADSSIISLLDGGTPPRRYEMVKHSIADPSMTSCRNSGALSRTRDAEKKTSRGTIGDSSPVDSGEYSRTHNVGKQTSQRSVADSRLLDSGAHSRTRDMVKQSSISSLVNSGAHSRRSQMAKQSSVSSILSSAAHPRRLQMAKQYSLRSIADSSLSRSANSGTHSRRLQIMKQSSRRSFDHSPVLPRRRSRYGDIHLDITDESLTGASQARRQMRNTLRDISPLRPQRSVDKSSPMIEVNRKVADEAPAKPSNEKSVAVLSSPPPPVLLDERGDNEKPSHASLDMNSPMIPSKKGWIKVVSPKLPRDARGNKKKHSPTSRDMNSPAIPSKKEWIKALHPPLPLDEQGDNDESNNAALDKTSPAIPPKVELISVVNPPPPPLPLYEQVANDESMHTSPDKCTASKQSIDPLSSPSSPQLSLDEQDEEASPDIGLPSTSPVSEQSFEPEKSAQMSGLSKMVDASSILDIGGKVADAGAESLHSTAAVTQTTSGQEGRKAPMRPRLGEQNADKSPVKPPPDVQDSLSHSTAASTATEENVVVRATFCGSIRSQSSPPAVGGPSSSTATSPSSFMLSRASSKRQKHRSSLVTLNSRMNAAIGVRVSPQIAPTTRKQFKSIEQRRMEAEASRERLRNRFKHFVSSSNDDQQV